MIELVTEPYVTVVAAPQFRHAAVIDFAREHGADALLDAKTPLARLASDYGSASDALVEFAGRFCYRSWAKGRDADAYMRNILESGHGSVLAHASISVIVTGVSRSLSHELVRHHVGTGVSQESQRYVTAENGSLEVLGYRAHRAVVPPAVLALGEGAVGDFRLDYSCAIDIYEEWRRRLAGNLVLPGLDQCDATTRKKRVTEAARAFLPNAAETRMVWTMNLRSARNIIATRATEHADLEIRRLAVEFARICHDEAPAVFQDLTIGEGSDGLSVATLGYGAV